MSYPYWVIMKMDYSFTFYTISNRVIEDLNIKKYIKSLENNIQMSL